MKTDPIFNLNAHTGHRRNSAKPSGQRGKMVWTITIGILLCGLAVADEQPAAVAPLHPDAKSNFQAIENSFGGPDPREEKVMVHTHVLLYWAGTKKRIMKCKMIDAPGRPNVFLAVFDKKLYEVNNLKLPVILLIEGRLHFGTAKSGTPRMRWKIREWRGRKYNDTRHWRTDRAVYILNPTFKAIREGVDWQAQKDAWVKRRKATPRPLQPFPTAVEGPLSK